jgi:hypothetical protein
MARTLSARCRASSGAAFDQAVVGTTLTHRDEILALLDHVPCWHPISINPLPDRPISRFW